MLSQRISTLVACLLVCFAGPAPGTAQTAVDEAPRVASVSAKVVTDTSHVTLGEGFYRPTEIALPAGVEDGLRSVVRVIPEIRFRVALFADRSKAQAQRAEGGPKKEFLPEGGVVWNTPIDTTTLDKMCGIPVAQVQPGLAEVCRLSWRAECSDFPCTLVSEPLSGSGTGVVVGRSSEHGLLIATPYHIARESIERQKRTDGTNALEPISAPDITVGVDTTGSMKPGGYAFTEAVTLLAIPDTFAPYVSPAPLSNAAPSPGDTLWAAGFPYRTIRKSAEAVGYSNANDELRVSVGRTVSKDSLSTNEVAPSDIVNTLDAVNGSSGSPVFDQQGQVVGIIRHGHCANGGGELNMRIARYCGVTLIAPLDSARQLIAN